MKKQFFVSLALIAASSLQAATIHVPGDHSTIQGAIDASSSGDTILIAANTYNLSEPLDINGKAITLRGEDGANDTLLDGNGNNTLLFIREVSGSGVTIDGLSFLNGQATQTVHGGCAVARNSVARFVNTHFEGCSTIDGNASNSGAAIKISAGSNARVENSTFTSNRSFSQGGAIHVFEATASITDNSFTGNVASGQPESGGGGVKVTFSVGDPVLIENNTFDSNEASFAGGAISVFGGDAHIINNEIINNGNGRFGGGIHLETAGTGQGGDREYLVINNTIRNNTILDVFVENIQFDGVSGAGMHINLGPQGDVTDSTIEIRGNIIDGNTATDSRCNNGAGNCGIGGGLVFFNARSQLQLFEDNEITGNVSDINGAAVFDKVRLEFRDNLVEGNRARYTHPGIACVSDSNSDATSCRIHRNRFIDNRYTSGTGTGNFNDTGAINVRRNSAWIFNNLFVENFGHHGTVFIRHEDTSGAFSEVDHNTFVDNDQESNFFGSLRLRGAGKIRSNVFVGDIRGFRADDLEGNAASEVAGNNITDTASHIARLEGANFNTVADLNNHPIASENTDDDPNFVDAIGGNFRLGSGSALINSVNCISEIDVDLEGNPRPIGSACDKGAFEGSASVILFQDRFEE